ncbi:MAG TPA: NAD(P)-binding protein [Gemmatimonadaceae bacterium]|nr:NAD(P)-binding protein [Gemmatimonadaceae bacterium]
MRKPFAITLDVGTSLANHTGTWRTERPEYVDRLPPCNDACPAGENVQEWLYHAEEGNYRAAWQAIMRDNPLPAIMGRACYHPCETACNRAQIDEAVGIHTVERFLGDLAIRERWPADPPAPATGKRVLIIGAGPSGLSAAYQLARMGHRVVIHEAGPLPGGMMRFGIPKYRLPREVLDAEIDRILALGVELHTDSPIEDIPRAIREGSFDACFAAIGAHLAARVAIPSPDAGRIIDALTLLRSAAADQEPPGIGRRVVVYGGGNTAMDAARTVRRLGADETVIVYRRTRAQMPAHEEELEEALAEGVQVHWLRTVKEATDEGIVVEKMRLDEDGWPQPTGELETIAADTVVLALGQNVDTSVLERVPGVRLAKDGRIEIGDDMMTGHPGLFAGGDMVPAERTITVAIGHGKKAARHIHAYLGGTPVVAAPRHELATFDALNTWYYTDADRTFQPMLGAIRRRTTFEEVHGGLDEHNALFEARRCLSCGNCFECDNCFGVCPDNAVVKLGQGNRYRIDLDYCKGCGICAHECPCGAIRMVTEER